MYITCPECRSSFVVDSAQIGLNGRMVKCSKCLNIWHAQAALQRQIKPSPTTTEHEFNPVGTEVGVNLPAVLPAKLPFYLRLIPIVLVSLVIFVSMELLSLFRTEDHGFSIKDIAIERVKDGGKIVVSYEVCNNSNTILTVPMVRIRFFDKNGKLLQTSTANSKEMSKDDVVLGVDQHLHVQTELDSIPKDVNKLDITIGDTIDFLLR